MTNIDDVYADQEKATLTKLGRRIADADPEDFLQVIEEEMEVHLPDEPEQDSSGQDVRHLPILGSAPTKDQPRPRCENCGGYMVNQWEKVQVVDGPGTIFRVFLGFGPDANGIVCSQRCGLELLVKDRS
jgi:hypothetical protein